MGEQQRQIALRRIEVIDDEMAAVLRAKTPAERLQMTSDMVASARRMLTSVLSAEHPEWSEVEVRREVARRISHGAV